MRSIRTGVAREPAIGSKGMARDLPITLALEAYDRTEALVDGRVRPPGIALTPLVVDSGPRHAQFLAGAYDAAEMSMSSYIMARERGLPFSAIAVFPRRLFSASCIYTRPGFAGGPERLPGGRIGVQTWQFTMSVVARGDLHHHYGVPMDSVAWVTAGQEILPIAPPPARIGHRAGADLNTLLAAGEIDALIYPDVIPPFEAGAAGRLFPDFVRVEQRLYHETGVLPVMHTVAIKDEVLAGNPWVAEALYQAFVEAKRIGYEHLRHPFNSSLLWSRALLEEQERLIPDPFPYDLGEGNRRALARLMQYQVEQGLITAPLTMEDLFLPVPASVPAGGA